MSLRPYQIDARDDIYNAWNSGHRNVLAVLPTGAGKTVLLSHIIHNWQGASCAIAHRQELVSQISTALAREGVVHKIIGPDNVIKGIVQIHMEEFGQNFYDPRAQCAVAGVDTLISWAKPESKHREGVLRWASQVTLWVCDEAHHPSGVSASTPDDFSTGNKWAKALHLFPNAYGLGVTATPERADGKGLGRGCDGVFDQMIVGPNMRDLINMGFLTEYRVFCPPSDLDLSTVSTGADGDFIRGQLALKTKESTILGDVVEHYKRLASGKRGITFVPDTDTAADMTARFNNAGVPAEMVTAKTPDRLRRHILKRFARGELLQLVNVDLFGEGFDLPAIEVVSMARATQSYALFTQQFGRALRLMEGKERAIIIDHVGNIGSIDSPRHGLPDRPRAWSLNRRERRSAGTPDDTIPMRNCLGGVHYLTGDQMEGCFQPYEAFHTACPYCGCKRVPAGRTAPEFVDGDLFELDADTLAAMRGEVAAVDVSPADVMQRYAHMGYIIAKGHANRHGERQTAQAILREAIGWWAAWHGARGRSEAECYKLFFLRFGRDVLTAQALGRADAEALTMKIYGEMTKLAGL